MRLARTGISTAAERVAFSFDGRPIEALAGERFVDALAASGIAAISRRDGSLRGQFCGMGVCSECLITIDGRAGERACLAKVRGGERVISGLPRGTADDPLAPLCPDPASTGAEEIVTDVLVIGAGPAGISAAIAAARTGAAVTILDERSDVGGQYLKPLGASQAASGLLDRQFRLGLTMTETLRSLPVNVLTDALVWGAMSRNEVLVSIKGRSVVFRPRSIVLATGAYERPHPFPGWTLPGVMTVGAAQTMVRSYGVAPGKRIAIAGNGPLNLQLAAELVEGGAEVVAIVESAPRPGLSKLAAVLAAVAADGRLMWDGARYIGVLRKARVPMIWGYLAVRAEGDLSVQRLLVSPADSEGRTADSRVRAIDADAVCLGYGFIASTEIARALGCRVHLNPRHLGSFAIETDESGRTSIEGIFACGDGATFGGAQIAMAAGAIAGAAAAAWLQPRKTMLPSAAERRSLRRAARFQRALWQIFSAPPARLADTPDDAIACRCEGITFGGIRAAVGEGCDTLAALKRNTRLGMGRCQGRYCVPVARHLLREGAPVAPELSGFAPRLPVKPFPAAALAHEKAEWLGFERSPAPRIGYPEEKAPFGTMKAGTLVVGAGILGACVALYLARAGEDVVIIDRDAVNLQSSGANAGSLHVQLLSFDFDNREMLESHAARALPLGPWSIDLWRQLAADSGGDFELQTTGGLMVADTPASMRFLEAKVALERKFGIEAEMIGRSDLLRLAPALADDLVGAELAPQEGKINPLAATYRVMDLGRAFGVRYFPSTDLRSLERRAGAWEAGTSRGVIEAKRVVNAAGPWAREVARLAGIDLPVYTGPIQMIVTEPGPPLVSQLVAYAGRHLSLKQAKRGGILIGGAWPARHDPARRMNVVLRESVEGNIWNARRVLPATRGLRVVRTWAGLNVNIDGAPIIGAAGAVPGFFNAITSNGYTLAPAVAKLCSEAIAGERPSFDLTPFGVERFS
jgi:glycine/D-amino acid oxidase-like deaminating enzyme/bacterioferritin-associated ferredoxin